MRVRAGRLYFRAQRYGLRGLEVKLRGFEKALRADPKSAGRRLKVGEVPLIYWTAAAWASAITLSKDQPEIVADLPKLDAIVVIDFAEPPEGGLRRSNNPSCGLTLLSRH